MLGLPKLPPPPAGKVTQSKLREAMMYVAQQTLEQVPLPKAVRLALSSYLAAMPDDVLNSIVDTILQLGARLDGIRRESKG